jgi:signal transduction histidine kinase
LNNIAKHSEATKAEIVLEPRQDDIVLIVEDNGRGFVPEEKSNPAGRELGLAGIRERATLMNGTMEIEATDGKGTSLFVRVPMEFRGDDGNVKK